LAYLPAIAFWVLDGWFLWHERMFRAHYDTVRQQPDPNSDFCMGLSTYKKQVPSWFVTCFSTTLLLFHGIVVAAIFITMLLLLTIG
jgi:hypothetical protein